MTSKKKNFGVNFTSSRLENSIEVVDHPLAQHVAF